MFLDEKYRDPHLGVYFEEHTESCIEASLHEKGVTITSLSVQKKIFIVHFKVQLEPTKQFQTVEGWLVSSILDGEKNIIFIIFDLIERADW